VKGSVPRDGYFIVGLKIKSVRWWFLKFGFLVVEKIISAVLTCFYEKHLPILEIMTVTLFKEPFAAHKKTPGTLTVVPEPAYDPEISYRKPPLHVHTSIGNVHYIYADFSCIRWGEDTGENKPMTERRVGRDIMIRLSELFLEKVCFYREASRNFIFIFLLNKAG
jgi:hypothetical protein